MHWWWGVLPYECVILNFIVWTCVGRHATYNAKAERNASRPSKNSMGGVFEGKLLQEPKCSVQNLLQIQSQRGRKCNVLDREILKLKSLGMRSPKFLKRTRPRNSQCCEFWKSRFPGAPCVGVFAPEFGLCEKIAIALSPPARRFLGTRCGLGCTADENWTASCAFY